MSGRSKKDNNTTAQSKSIGVPVQPVAQQANTTNQRKPVAPNSPNVAAGKKSKIVPDTKFTTNIPVGAGGLPLDEQTHSSKSVTAGSGSKSKKPNPSSPNPAPEPDAGSTAVGTLQQGMKDYEKMLQEKEKLLDARKKELDEKDEQINKLSSAADGANAEVEQCKTRITELETQLAAHIRALQDTEKAAADNMELKEKLSIQLTNEMSDNWYLKDALTKETDKLKNNEERARLVAHNYNETIQDLTKERNELRSRLSKAASDMLTAGGNPDIADLSDPNRALKLSERFSSLYDDPWTDAFEALTQHHHQDPKAVIQQLFSILKTCFEFCKETEESQMDSLRNLFLHPCQAASQDVKAGKHKVTIGTSDDKALKDLRRRIATNSSYVVKAQCMSHLNKQLSAKDDVTMSAARAYSESCIELCWLMVLHDPPLHLELDVKPGTKMGSHYSNYGGSGDTIDYVVWPPLYNGPGGGMLTKGTAAPQASKKKLQKK